MWGGPRAGLPLDELPHIWKLLGGARVFTLPPTTVQICFTQFTLLSYEPMFTRPATAQICLTQFVFLIPPASFNQPTNQYSRFVEQIRLSVWWRGFHNKILFHKAFKTCFVWWCNPFVRNQSLRLVTHILTNICNLLVHILIHMYWPIYWLIHMYDPRTYIDP